MKKNTLLLFSVIITSLALSHSLSADEKYESRLNYLIDNNTPVYGTGYIPSPPLTFILENAYSQTETKYSQTVNNEPEPKFEIGDYIFAGFSTGDTKVVFIYSTGTSVHREEFPLALGTYKMEYNIGAPRDRFTMEIEISESQFPIRVKNPGSTSLEFENARVYLIKVSTVWAHPEFHQGEE